MQVVQIKVGDLVRVRRRIKRNVNGGFGSAIESGDNAFEVYLKTLDLRF